MSGADGPYHDVRALKRGLRLLEVLGQAGWSKPTALSTLAGIDRSSTYRLLSTLREAGYVVRRDGDGSFALTGKVKILADGFTDADRLAQIAAQHLQRLTAQISWPCDFAILTGGEGVIVESTHRLSPMSMHRAMIGKRRSLMSSALGQAMLCVLTDDERDLALNLVKEMGGIDAGAARERRYIERILKNFEANGYTSSSGSVETKIASIALPIRVSYSVVGAVNIIFFRSALTVEQAAERYLPSLRECAEDIQRDVGTAHSQMAFPSEVSIQPGPPKRSVRKASIGARPGPKYRAQAERANLRSAILANKAEP